MEPNRFLTYIGLAVVVSVSFYGIYRFAKWRGMSFPWEKEPAAPPAKGGGGPSPKKPQ